MLKFSFLNKVFLAIFVVFSLLRAFKIAPFYFLFFPLISYVGFLVWGSAEITLNFYFDSIHRLKSKQHVLLTFDDGPHPVFTRQILDLLDDYDVKSIFFVMGNQAKEHAGLLKEMVRRGHLIGNHSYHHSTMFDLFPLRRMKYEIEKTNQVIEKITGQKPVYFRPPFGITNPRLARVLKQTGMISVGWSFRSFDGGKRSNEKIMSQLTKKISGGEIVLFHDNRARTVELLKTALPFLSRRFELNNNNLNKEIRHV
jgi:peptidoglycan/xylan/chitin deacetylase (PgdA/CDA1 family)